MAGHRSQDHSWRRRTSADELLAQEAVSPAECEFRGFVFVVYGGSDAGFGPGYRSGDSRNSSSDPVDLAVAVQQRRRKPRPLALRF